MAELSNEKYECFAQCVATGMDGRQAAIQAGFAETSAHVAANRMKKRPEVAARIIELSEVANAPLKQVLTQAAENHAASQDEASSRLVQVGFCREWVLSQLVENVQMAKAAVPVLDGDGEPTGEYKANLPAANQALQLLGKELGMFVDRKEVSTTGFEELLAEAMGEDDR